MANNQQILLNKIHEVEKKQLLDDLFKAMEAKITVQAEYERVCERADAAWESYMAFLKESRERPAVKVKDEVLFLDGKLL